MNDIVKFDPTNPPAFARNRSGLSDLAKSLMGGGGMTGKRISTSGGVFRLYADGKEIASIDDRYLDVVIVNSAPNVGRTFYAGNYDPETKAAPACWSADGERPDTSVKAPQSAACATCKQNVAGSGAGESKACRFSQRIAVVIANNIGGDVLQLSVSATSLFGKAEGTNMPLQAYARWLAAGKNDPKMVITRMRFDTKAQHPKLFFAAQRYLDEAEYETACRQGETPEALAAITMTVSQMDKVQPTEAKALVFAAPEAGEEPVEAPKAAKASKAAKPAKPKADEGTEEGVEEPVKRQEQQAKPTAVSVKGSSALASIAAAWDTDD